MPTRRRTAGARKRFAPRIVPAGDSAVMLELADELDLEANAAAQRVADAVRAAALDGVTDVVAAIVTVTVHFDAADAAQAAARRDAIGARLLAALTDAQADDAAAERTVVEIPVCYETRYAPDLAAVAAATGLDADEVVRLHVGVVAPGADDRVRARLSLHRRTRPAPHGAAARDAASAARCGFGGDRQRADRGVPVRDPGWLEHHRTHAAAVVRRGAHAGHVAAGGRSGRVRPITALEFDRLATEPERR